MSHGKYARKIHFWTELFQSAEAVLDIGRINIFIMLFAYLRFPIFILLIIDIVIILYIYTSEVIPAVIHIVRFDRKGLLILYVRYSPVSVYSYSLTPVSTPL